MDVDEDLILLRGPELNPPAVDQGDLALDDTTFERHASDEADIRITKGERNPVWESSEDELAPEVKNNIEAAMQLQHENDMIRDSGDGEEQNDVETSFLAVNSDSLQPIEIVLTPPPDPQAFEQISSNTWDVERILSDATVRGETWFTMQFEDGHTEKVAYDDAIQLRGGSRAVKLYYRDQEFGMERASIERNSNKRSRSVDEFQSANSSSSESDFALNQQIPPRQRKVRRSVRQHVPTRRSLRQTTSPQVSDASDDNKYSDHNNSEVLNLEGTEDEDDRDAHLLSGRSAKGHGRQLRPRDPELNNYNMPLSDDELGHDRSWEPVTSDVLPAKKTRSSGRKKNDRANQVSSRRNRYRIDDSDIEFEDSRGHLKRSAQPSKKLREVEVDEDYGYADELNETAPKYVSAKELFQQLPPNSLFRQMHASTCETCRNENSGGKGPLIYCQGCSMAYHKPCIGVRSARDHRVTKIGQESFVLQCRHCIGVMQKKDRLAPNRAACQVCQVAGAACSEFSIKKTAKQEDKLREENGGEDPITDVEPSLINNADHVLFRCLECKCAFHFDHLPPLGPEDILPEDIKSDRRDEYADSGWRCRECVRAQYKLQGLVAWRPLDQQTHREGQSCTDLAEDAKEYLVKWESRSHFHDTWMPGPWVYGIAATTTRNAFNKRPEVQQPKMKTEDAVPEEWLLADVFFTVKYSDAVRHSTMEADLKRISQVKSVLVKFQGLPYSDVVHDEPPPEDSGAPWDAFVQAYQEYLEGQYFPLVSDKAMASRLVSFRKLDFETECELTTQPPGLQRGNLMEYQLQGLNWLLYSFHRQHNVILADEMGLGKTVQVVSLITTLVQDQPRCWPFLVVVPNATCANWRRELKQWAPGLRVVTYHGGRAAQELAFRHELFPEGIKAGMRAHVVIMSYEAAVGAHEAFRGVKWVGLIVDEGQRLKNEQSLLYLALQRLKIPFRLLLTGTPLQNNKRELFNLLQFIDPEKNNAEELDLQYAELTKDNIPKLHDMIRPYFLRRTKVQVLKFLPPMAQIILPVSMSVVQEKVCKSILARNPDLIRAIISKSKIKAGEKRSLNNILSDLRQCLCHPFAFNESIEDRSITDLAQIQHNLVAASGKLMLLNIMLPKLKERGHRVLIFSQFLHSLTILEDFLTGLGLEHIRIDGNHSALEKQKRIDAFNADGSSLFAMLLSTRAGGVGINLYTADTVIIYDPDFNPHQDIQALSRAHRIGQKNKVLCFQLMTKNTVEEKIMQMGRKKMALDHALIESMDADDAAGNDLESILKHGAEALFSDDAKDQIVFDSASVDKLLDRSQMETTSSGDDQSAESQFSFARVWANDEGALTANNDGGNTDDDGPADPSVWENILKQREEEHQREQAAMQKEYGRGARRRGKDIDYHNSYDPQEPEYAGAEMEVEDELYIDGQEAEESEGDQPSDIDVADEGKSPQDPANLGRPNPKSLVNQPTRPAEQPPSPDLTQRRRRNKASTKLQKSTERKPRLQRPAADAQPKLPAAPLPPTQTASPPKTLPSSVPMRNNPPATAPRASLDGRDLVSVPVLRSNNLPGWDRPHLNQSSASLSDVTYPPVNSNLTLRSSTTPQSIPHDRARNSKLKMAGTRNQPLNTSQRHKVARKFAPGQCPRCRLGHHSTVSCVDQNSNEIDIRLALDSLRDNHRAPPGLISYTRSSLRAWLSEKHKKA